MLSLLSAGMVVFAALDDPMNWPGSGLPPDGGKVPYSMHATLMTIAYIGFMTQGVLAHKCWPALPKTTRREVRFARCSHSAPRLLLLHYYSVLCAQAPLLLHLILYYYYYYYYYYHS